MANSSDSTGSDIRTDNFLTGIIGTEGWRTENRSFFVFTGLDAFAETFTSVDIRLFNCSSQLCPTQSGIQGYRSPNAFEFIDLFDVSTPVGSLPGSAYSADIFADLGTGTRYGSARVSADDNGQFVSFMLNADGLAAFEAARTGSGEIAIGGALRMSTVPEPGTYALVAVGLGALFVARRRRAA